MYKILSLLICTTFLSNAFSQTFQGTIKPGTTLNSVICAIRPTGNNLTDKPLNIQLTVAIPVSVGARPTMTVINNRYSAFFNNINVFQAATYANDYIYLVDLALPTLTTNKAYIENTEDTVLELSFAGNIGNRSDMRLVQLPNGNATSGAGTENGQYNFFTQFATAGERTNETAMFYNTTGGVVVNNPLGYSGYSSVTVGSGFLPVKWLNFSVVKHNNEADLRWEVANQVNIDHYEIEVGRDVHSFSRIGTIPCSENKSIYTFTDINLSRIPGQYAYYRVKQLDKDGKFTYSEIKKLSVGSKEFSFKVIINPIKGRELKVGIQSYSADKGIIRIFDLNDRQIYQRNISWASGYSQQIIQLPNIAAGSYLASLSMASGQYQAKFVK